MTVRELITLLQAEDPDALVTTNRDSGYWRVSGTYRIFVGDNGSPEYRRNFDDTPGPGFVPAVLIQ